MVRVWSALLVILLILFTLFSDHSWDAAKPYPPGELGYLVDPSGRMDIVQAASPEMADRYVVKRGNRMSLGFSRAALWLRFALDQAADSGPWVLVVAAPWIDRIDLFLPDPAKGWQRQYTGLQQPGASATVGGFALTVPAEAPRSGYGYLRLESVLALNASLRLWPKAEMEQHVLLGAYFYGGLYGIMLAMACLNFLVFLATRDRTNLFYVLYLLGMLVHQFCLQGQILLLPMRFWPVVPRLSLVVSAFVFFFGTAFCRTFLDAKVHAPAADRLLIGAQMAAAVLLVLALTNRLWWGTWLTHSLAVAGPLVAIAAGIQAIRKGYWPARIYLLAWLVLLIGIVGWGAWSMGWLDSLRPRQMTLTVAAALESCLLTLALAERVRLVHLERRVLAQRERRYHQLSITDELTGLYNQRYFWSQLASELEHAHELGQPLSLLLMDLDDFKGINDSHGHDVGDRILAGVGCLLRENVRPVDSACRYGGEEFALILPGAYASAAMEVAERVRRALAELAFPFQHDPPPRITASLGIAQLTPTDDISALFKRADQSLYQAKTKGKNQISCAIAGSEPAMNRR